MKSDYDAMLAKAAECELLASVAQDESIREKSAERAKEYRVLAEGIRRVEEPPWLGRVLH